MNLIPSETDRELASAVRTWAHGLGDRVMKGERAGTLPLDVVKELGDLGVLGMTIPERYGGLGASTVAFALVLEELAAAWPSLAVGVSVNSGIVVNSVLRYGSEAQRQMWLPKLQDGQGLGAFALTEPSSGSDAASLKATAARDGEGWRVTGRKQFITSARYAPFFVVMARVGEATAERPHNGVTAFIVPADAPGLWIGAPESKMGLRASDTSAIVLDDARLGGDAQLGEIGKGIAIALAGLDGGRIGIAAQALGIARAALELASSYSRKRRQFGSPLSSFQAIRFSLAKIRMEIDAARLLAHRAARLRDSGAPFTKEASMAKLYASEAAQRATHAALQVFGGYGYMTEYDVERYARDARATTLYEGTSEIQRLVIARSLIAA